MFYTYEQYGDKAPNGKHVIDDHFGHYMIIEADSYQEAESQRKDLGIEDINQWGCSFSEGNSFPIIWTESVETYLKRHPICPWPTGGGAQKGKPWVIHIYYKNGDKETITSSPKE